MIWTQRITRVLSKNQGKMDGSRGGADQGDDGAQKKHQEQTGPPSGLILMFEELHAVRLKPP
jgi:hypothetical protein